MSEAHLLDFSAVATINTPFPEACLSCSQTTVTMSLFTCPLSFLSPGPWAQFSLVPNSGEIGLRIYSKSVALEAILMTSGP